MASSRKKTLQRLRVPFGFIFAGIYVIFAAPTWITIAVGGGFGLLGIGLRAWSAGHIRKNKVLAVSGPYRFTRNPLYLGSFIMGLGLMGASGLWWLTILFAVLFLCIYLPVMSVEAEELTSVFGEKYEAYARAVPLFFPGFRRGMRDDKKFEPELYLRYREYQAFLGYLAIIAVLVGKIIFF